MKNNFRLLGILLLAVLLLPAFASAQSNSTGGLHFEMNKVYPYTSISSADLQQAKTLLDLDARYKPSWVRTYVSVEVSVIHKGKPQHAVGKREVLTQAQKNLLDVADKGEDIYVKVLYYPENTLRENDVKEYDFTLSVDPDSDATFPGGHDALNQYLQKNAIEKIPSGIFVDYDMAAVKFTVNESGEITNARVFQAFKNEKVDALLLDAIRKMPCWKPAQYADGTQVKQDFVLTVGNMENCNVSLLSIRRR
jgi:TonB family protein